MRHRIQQPHRVIPDSFIKALHEVDETMRADTLKQLARKLAEGGRFLPATILAGLVRGADALLIVLAAGITHALYLHEAPAAAEPAYYAVCAFAASIMFAGFAQARGHYRRTVLFRPLDTMPKLLVTLICVFGVLLSVIVFAKLGEEFSRVWLGSWFATSALLLVCGRLVTSRLVARWSASGQLNRRAVLVGGGKRAEQVLGAITAEAASDVSIIGIFDDRCDRRSPAFVAGHAKLGSVAELAHFVRDTRVDLLIVTLPIHAEQRLLTLLKQLWVLPVDIRLSAYSQKLRYCPRAYSFIGDLPLIDILDKPLDGWNSVIKAAEDRCLALLATVFALPVMALIALAIKLESPGPVLFRQRRYGFNNELIEIYKFRSMYTDKCDATASRLVTRSDPRVTRVGRFIRRTSLDELPQLFNVLRGQLSLVGPRPHATEAKARNALYDEVVEGYFARHKVKPGITGWAQVNGWRGETDTHEKIEKRVEHDLYYIENWSLAFDLYILAKTPVSLLTAKSAY